MIKITITENQGNQRLDRFLKKYFDRAPLSHIYKLIRKDVKVNGKRQKEDAMLAAGDELTIYLSEEDAKALQTVKKHVKAKRQFRIAYEDENVLVCEKPFGLLTHGDHTEKKNHLANQVVDYLIQTGAYQPRLEKTFTPAPANRLDRNTTGLVIFGKHAPALQELNRMIRTKDTVRKLYLTIVCGKLEKPMRMRAKMTKNEAEKYRTRARRGRRRGKDRWKQSSDRYRSAQDQEQMVYAGRGGDRHRQDAPDPRASGAGGIPGHW